MGFCVNYYVDRREAAKTICFGDSLDEIAPNRGEVARLNSKLKRISGAAVTRLCATRRPIN